MMIAYSKRVVGKACRCTVPLLTLHKTVPYKTVPLETRGILVIVGAPKLVVE
jgi:hypothetical protein